MVFVLVGGTAGRGHRAEEHHQGRGWRCRRQTLTTRQIRYGTERSRDGRCRCRKCCYLSCRLDCRSTTELLKQTGEIAVRLATGRWWRWNYLIAHLEGECRRCSRLDFIRPMQTNRLPQRLACACVLIS